MSNLSEEISIFPQFSERNNVLAMSSSNEYVPYLSVCLESIKANMSPEQNYDIIIFERSITDNNKRILKNQVAAPNISLRFLNPEKYLKSYNLKFSSNYNLECYFRLTAPLLLKNFSKVLFTDVDLIYVKDPAELYGQSVKDYPLAACLDFIMGAFINNSKDKGNWREYLTNVLGLKDVFRYFNTGVMLFNIDYLNKINFVNEILDKVSKTQYRILEQDGLNAYFQDGIKYIDSTWNFPVAGETYSKILNLMPQEFFEKYQQDRKSPGIIHFAGLEKPWHSFEQEFADIWWEFARKTPFYEVLLERYLGVRFAKQIEQQKKYKKYYLLSKLLFGEKRKYYKAKCRELKRFS